MVGWKGNLFGLIANYIPVKLAFSIRYYYWNRRWPDLDNPKRFTEKMMWLTYYNGIYKSDLIKEIYDKHTVRRYVENKGLKYILTEELGNYKNPNDIDFALLPQSFIIKATQSSGQNIIVSNKKEIEEKEIKEKLSQWLSQNKNVDRFQGYYYTEEESVMCEELLHDSDGMIPCDYRICCCNGIAKWIYCDIDAIDSKMKHKKEYHREYYDVDWNFLPVDNPGRKRICENSGTLEKPKNLREMIEIAEALSKDFIFVRVDLYNINGKIYFGELTPIPGMAGGFDPDEWDITFGEMITLPNKRIW